MLQQVKNTTSEAILRKIRDKAELGEVSTLPNVIRKRGQPNQQEATEKFNVNLMEQERLFTMRKNFQTSLNKLSHNDTKEIVISYVNLLIGVARVQKDN